jgi:tetratricopeptide (TPR) repeat protein
MYPRSFEAYVDLGAAYNDTNRWQEGSVAFRKAIDVGGDHPGMYAAHYNLGLAYSHLNSPELAALEFSKSLKLKPDFAPARDALAQMQNALRPPPAAKPF